MIAHIQLALPGIGPDPHYCTSCGGYTRINPRCLHPHKLSKLVLVFACESCAGRGVTTNCACFACGGRGYSYEIVSESEARANPLGRVLADGTLVPYMNRL